MYTLSKCANFFLMKLHVVVGLRWLIGFNVLGSSDMRTRVCFFLSFGSRIQDCKS